MSPKPRIAIVGAGNLASALAVSLGRAGYKIEAVIGRSNARSRKRARLLAKQVGARPSAGMPTALKADVVWFGVSDSEIGKTAQSFAPGIDWKTRVALHSSGALTSDELDALRRRGAAVASVHPLMTFVRGSRPSLKGVPFAIEGDASAVRLARRIVKDLGGNAHRIRKSDKAAYHAWGTFASPLVIALLATAERVAAAAGVPRNQARRRSIPILRQTLENYRSLGAAGAFSGPIVRGNVETVKQHLRALGHLAVAREAYRALGKATLRYLPAKNRAALRYALRS